METKTTVDQRQVEEVCIPLLAASSDPTKYLFFRDKHVAFLRKKLGILPPAFVPLDASRPWMVFWAVNGLAMMGENIEDLVPEIEASVLKCQAPTGGFGGGAGQTAHLACTYAAVMALAHTRPSAWKQIDRLKMHSWILSLKQPDGSFRVCLHGETDPRATYCALAVARLLGICDAALTANIGEYIKGCQTYEGGFGNQPGAEAHGGYAFCALATLHLVPDLDPTQYFDLPKFLRWLVARQQGAVPGFSGRTNKLVDGCYGHWVGGCWALVESITDIGDLWNRDGLQDYSIMCCQAPQGGLRDKPGCAADAYHTNYVLCGMAACQYAYKLANGQWEASAQCDPCVRPLHPLYGLPMEVAGRAAQWVD